MLARQGMGIREIAREIGCSRNTIKRYLRDAQASRYGPRAPRPTKLDAFKAYLEARIEAARPQWIPAVVLLREIRERGYEGGLTQLKTFLAPHKRAPADPVVRFETAPGEQMQVDFTVVRRGREPQLAFVATLGYSRASWVRFTTGEDTETLVACLRDALAAFGGTPLHVLFDNAKSVVIERDAYGDGLHRWNKALLALSDEYGFALRLCRPYRARTKGKVERFNGYLKGSFLVPLAASHKAAGLRLDAQAANAHIGRWLAQVANARIHGTTGQRPDRRLAIERAAMMPLPRSAQVVAPAPQPSRRPVPIESLQHPLSVYEALLAVRA